MSFLKNTSITLVSNVGIAVINFLMIILVSRTLGASGRGEIALIMIDIALTQILFGVIGGYPIVYYLPKVKKLSVVISLGVLGVLPLTILAHLTLQFFNESEYRFFTFMISFFMNLNYIGLCVYISRKKMTVNALLNLLPSFITFVLFYFIKFPSINDYLWIFLVGQLLVTLGLYKVWLELLLEPFRIELVFWKKIIRYGVISGYNNAVQFLGYRVSFYFILWYLSDKAVLGQFSNAIALCEALRIISRSISMNLYAEVVNEPNKATTLMIQSMKLILFLLTPGILVLILTPSEVYEFVFTKEFDGIKTYMYYLLPGVFLSVLSSALSNYFSALNLNYINSITVTVCLFLTIILLTILVPNYALIGAALATSIGYSCSFFILGWFYYFHHPTT